MSTSEQALAATAAPEPANGALGMAGSEGITPGILSPAELARMANEMFNALPDEIQQPAITAARVMLPANSAFSGNPYAALPNPTAPAVPGILAGFTELQPSGFIPVPDRSAPPDVQPSASAPGRR